MKNKHYTKVIPFWKWLKEHSAKYDISKSNPPALKIEELEGIKLPIIDFGKNYFHGSPQLKKKIAEMYDVSEENVFIGSSASDTNDLVIDALIRKGDRILVESPVYPPLLESPRRRAKLVGAKIKTFKRKYEEGFSINVKEVSKLMDKHTRLLVMTNLHNPSGVKTDEKTMKSLESLAEEHNSYLVIDEVYRRYCPGLKSAYPSNKKTLITDSMTKYYGAASLRIGWAIGEQEIIKELYTVQGYRNVVNCSYSEDMTTVLLQNPKLFDERIKKHHDNNFRIFEGWLKTRNDIELVMPDGKFCCFPKLTNVKDTSEFVEELYKKYNMLIVPGEFYGLKGHVRICFGCETTVLEAALENIEKALDNHKNCSVRY